MKQQGYTKCKKDMFFGFCLTNKGEAVWTICWKVVAKGGNTSKWIFFNFLVTSKKAANASPPEKMYGVRMLNPCIATSFLTKMKI